MLFQSVLEDIPGFIHQIFPGQTLKSRLFTQAIYQDMDLGTVPRKIQRTTIISESSDSHSSCHGDSPEAHAHSRVDILDAHRFPYQHPHPVRIR